LIGVRAGSEDHEMILLIWIALPAIILGSGSFMLWSINKHELPML
jgi:hypothetical protein